MQSIIHLENIRKNYFLGKQVIEVLKGISLDIKKNEYVALMGPSGSGKSTLMNILGCLDTPTAGTYVLNGQDVSRWKITRWQKCAIRRSVLFSNNSTCCHV